MSSVVAIQPVAAVFREEQYFDWRVYSLIAIVGLATGIGLLRGRVWSLEVILGLLIGLGLLMFLIVFVLHMTTEVNAGGFDLDVTVKRRLSPAAIAAFVSNSPTARSS
jgi:hypothetical protein